MDLLSAAQKLDPPDRLSLIEHLLDSLGQPDEAIDAFWVREAEDRLSAYQRGDIKAFPVSDTLAKYGSR